MKKRDIEVPFLGGRVTVKVGSADEEYMLKLNAILKTRSVGYKDGVLFLDYEGWIIESKVQIACPVHIFETRPTMLQCTGQHWQHADLASELRGSMRRDRVGWGGGLGLV
jgi:hypothetical protein